MHITKEIVEYAADLSKIKLNESERDKLIEELSEVLNYIEILNKLDTKDTEPLSHIFAVNNITRADIVKDSYPAEILLSNAPDNEFSVPKTIKEIAD